VRFPGDCAVDIIKKVESLADELVTVFEEALLDLALTRRVEVVGVSCSGVDVFDDGVHVDDVLLVKVWTCLLSKLYSLRSS